MSYSRENWSAFTRLKFQQDNLVFKGLINQEAPYVQDYTVTKEDFNKKEMQVGKRRTSLNQMGGIRRPLFSIIVQCLHDIPDQRPSSRELVRRMEEWCKHQPSPHINTLETLAELKQQNAELETLNSRVKEKDQAIIAKQRENDELHTLAKVILKYMYKNSTHVILFIFRHLGLNCRMSNRSAEIWRR